MLETVAKGFKAARNKLKGRTEITAEVIDDALRDIRVSLLEADVAFDVVKRFVARVREKAVGEVVETKVETKKGLVKVSPQDHFIKICHDELEALMGPVDTSLKVKARGTSSVMMVGLQGSGKTTTAGKLAKRFLEEGKKPLLVAADIYRPAAVDQLKALGGQLGVPVFHQAGLQPPELCRRALEQAQKERVDVVIYDTAGRLAIDEILMKELEDIKQAVEPDNILLVCDAMIGQDAVRSATEFHERLGTTGVILTKLDGDARGGAALSIHHVTGQTIKFIGLGEKYDALEVFHPDRIVSRILGMGDVLSLIEKAEEKIDKQKALEVHRKIQSDTFTLQDFRDQLRQVRSLGPVDQMLGMLPKIGIFKDAGKVKMDEKELVHIEAIINSMTPQERNNHEIINGRRRKRIARGSGTSVQEINQLLRQFYQTRKMMKTMSQNLLGKQFGGVKGPAAPAG